MLVAHRVMLRTYVLPVAEDGVWKAPVLFALCAALDVINAVLLRLVTNNGGANALAPAKMAALLAMLITHAQNAQKHMVSIMDNVHPVVIVVTDAMCFKRVGQVT